MNPGCGPLKGNHEMICRGQGAFPHSLLSTSKPFWGCCSFVGNQHKNIVWLGLDLLGWVLPASLRNQQNKPFDIVYLIMRIDAKDGTISVPKGW